MSRQRKADLLLVLATAFWGVSYYLLDLCLTELQPLTLNAFRFLTAFFVLGAIFFRKLRGTSRRTLLASIPIGLCLVLTYIGCTYGVLYTSLSNAGFICALPVVVTPLLEWLFLRKRPDRRLAVALALYSGLCDKVIPEKLMVFGEVGLGGEVRAASHVRERVKEGARLGFERCIIPKQSFSSLSRSENYGIQIIGVRTLEQAFRAINADKEKENKE